MFARLLKFFDILRRTLGALFFLAIIGLLGAAFLSERASIPDGALLVLAPEGEIVEAINAPTSFPPDFSSVHQVRLHDLVRVIRTARDDDQISGILLDVQDMGHASLPALQSLGKEIDLFKQSGKKVTAYADHYSQTQYHLAAHADEVWLHPMGMVLLSGLSSYRNYFADALERMHVKIHLFRAGSYKSAAEPLVRNDMSRAAREETRDLLNQLWKAYKSDIAATRPISPQAIQALLDDAKSAIEQYNGDPAALAKGHHLVDHIGTRSELMQALTGANIDAPLVEFHDYLHSLGRESESDAPTVGILTASGTLTDGLLDDGGLNGDAFSKLIDMAIEDDHIKAVVLRIDSPGGSVQASETIRRSLLKLRKTGKPLVVSMAGMAASGGYWIAAEADEIWTAPTTLTGSIGVFGVFPNVSGGLQSLGVHNDGVGTTPIAGAMRPDRPLPQTMADVLQAGVDHVYGRFLGIVADGRHMDKEQAGKLAEGRVWSGSDAVRLGLADHLGGLDDAVAAAAKRAALAENYAVRHIHAPQKLQDILLERLFGGAEIHLSGLRNTLKILQTLTGGLSDGVLLNGSGTSEWLRMLKPSGGIYAYCGLSPS